MKTPFNMLCGVGVLIVAVWVARSSADVKADTQGMVTIEGELRSATSLFGETKPKEKTSPLAAGEPGGVLVEDRFVLLLVDGRVLAKLEAVLPTPDTVVRVRGISHDTGRSLTPVRIEYKSGDGWRVFDLPLSGTLAPSVLGGDE
jgi:hypothetical protein